MRFRFLTFDTLVELCDQADLCMSGDAGLLSLFHLGKAIRQSNATAKANVLHALYNAFAMHLSVSFRRWRVQCLLS